MAKRFSGLAEHEVDSRRGRIIKYLGDGFLPAFSTPTDIVEAALAIHSSVADDNDIQPDTARIRRPLRGSRGIGGQRYLGRPLR